MRVLLDKNVPYGVRRFLSHHSVETVDDRGWQQISNGELLAAAELAGFEVVVTADQNIVYQQNLRNRKIALVILGSNIWPLVQTYSYEIDARVSAAEPGTYHSLKCSHQELADEDEW